MKNRREKFDYLMNLLEEAEGKRDTGQGAFSFLAEGSYVRRLVVTPGMKTGIAGLKTFLSTEVLEIFGANNRSKVSYKNIQAHLSGNESKKYSFCFDVLDEVFDEEKNNETMLANCWIIQDKADIRECVRDTTVRLPYLLLERVRAVAWKKLSVFYKLCEQEGNGDNTKKIEVYFQFIQALALYEIFLEKCVMNPGYDYGENAMSLIKELNLEVEQIARQGAVLKKCSMGQVEESEGTIKLVFAGIVSVTNRHTEELCPMLSTYVTYKVLTADFGISYTAMCYLLMVFEAMNVCDASMRGLRKSSLKIRGELAVLYGKDMEVLQRYNRNRGKRYRMVNEMLEDILDKYGDKECESSELIVTFLEELCKSPKSRKIDMLHDIECRLGHPVYRDLGGC